MGLPLVASAQMSAYGMPSTDAFTMAVAPQYPQPYGQASLSFTSANLDLTNATLSVSVNGKGLYSGDVRTVAVPLGAPGTPIRVLATVTENGQTYTQTATIAPQDVALVIEPESSAPPLYLGKPFIPLGGSSRLVAVANLSSASGKSIAPQDVSYVWTVDGQQLANASGIGKDALVVSSPLEYRDRTVSVIVQSQDGAEVGGASVTLTAQNPIVRLYENDPLRGIRFGRALSGAFSITTPELSLYAAPFSFPTDTGAPTLSWFINGSSSQSGSTITLRPTGSGQGSANVSVTASSVSATANTSMSLIFGSKSSSIFGL